MRGYGAERSGQIEYRFNAHGYRGEELDPAARRRIVVCGCSHTLGVGVAEEDAWPARLRARYAEHAGLRSSEVNLVNLAQGAASNDYVARTMLAQLPRVRADLAVVLFTNRGRAERWDGDAVFGLGPWTLEALCANPELSETRPILRAAQHHYALTSDAQERLDTLKNMLLVQLLCRAQGVPALTAWIEHASLDAPEMRASPLLAPLVDALDRSRVCDVSPLDDDVLVDRAADGSHAGPRSHALFAERLFERVLALEPAPDRLAA